MNLQSAISVFINNIAVLAIENCLIKDLAGTFSPTLTANMDDEQLHAIAAESEGVRYERSSLQKKLQVLQSGRQILYEHIGRFVHPLDMKIRSNHCPHSTTTFDSSSSTHATKSRATAYAAAPGQRE
jgi:hypothetical protein